MDDPDKRMLAGLTAEVTVPLKEKTDVLLVPNEAITYTDGAARVTAVNENNRQTIEIRIGIITDTMTEVTSANLQEGQELSVIGVPATDGPQRTRPDRPAGPPENGRQNINGS